MAQAKIEIVIDSSGKVSYHSSLHPAATVFYMEFVKFDLLLRQRGEGGGEEKILVPQIIPPARPEG